MAAWRVVTSKKPKRQGEAFLMLGDTFIAKVYKDAMPDPEKFCAVLAELLNKTPTKEIDKIMGYTK